MADLILNVHRAKDVHKTKLNSEMTDCDGAISFSILGR